MSTTINMNLYASAGEDFSLAIPNLATQFASPRFDRGNRGTTLSTFTPTKSTQTQEVSYSNCFVRVQTLEVEEAEPQIGKQPSEQFLEFSMDASSKYRGIERKLRAMCDDPQFQNVRSDLIQLQTHVLETQNILIDLYRMFYNTHWRHLS